MTKRSQPAKRDARVEVRILRDHDYRHNPATTQAFRAGQTAKIPPTVARALIEAEVAEPITANQED